MRGMRHKNDGWQMHQDEGRYMHAGKAQGAELTRGLGYCKIHNLCVWGIHTCRAAMTTVVVSGASLLDRRVVLPITEDQALNLNVWRCT